MKTLTLFCIIILFTGNLWAQTVEVSRKKIKALVEDWNAAHSEKNAEKFEKLYASVVLFYGQTVSRQQCINTKTDLFKKYDYIDQRIASNDLLLTAYQSGKIKCEFIKEVSINGNVKNYPSYLIIIKNNGKYLIAGESDKITDSNLRYHLNLGATTRIVNVEESDKPISLAKPENDRYSFSFLKLILPIGLIVIIGIVWKSVVQRPGRSFLPLTTSPQSNGEVTTAPLSIGHPTMKANANLVIADGVSIVEHKQTLSPAEMGRQFEEYAITKFNPQYFIFLDWRSDKIARGIYPKSNQYPDLQYEFKIKKYRRKFAVECKFRSDTFNNSIKLAEPWQMERYRLFQADNNIDVYLFLGLGGAPAMPRELFIIPLDHIDEHIVHYSFLNCYRKSMESLFFLNQKTGKLS